MMTTMSRIVAMMMTDADDMRECIRVLEEKRRACTRVQKDERREISAVIRRVRAALKETEKTLDEISRLSGNR